MFMNVSVISASMVRWLSVWRTGWCMKRLTVEGVSPAARAKPVALMPVNFIMAPTSLRVCA
jgi:hypothetical protein